MRGDFAHQRQDVGRSEVLQLAIVRDHGEGRARPRLLRGGKSRTDGDEAEKR
jgi:hypothetical protein